MRLLLVEDELEIQGFLRQSLGEAGYEIDVASDGRTASLFAGKVHYDGLIVDLGLPDQDGIDLILQLRRSGLHSPVLILSARRSVDDRVKGLEQGGDDYLTKPFAFSELLARVEALSRRSRPEAPSTKLAVGDLEVDLLSRTVKRAGQKIELQPREFRLLEFLARHAGQVVTRTMLLEGVWDYHFDPQTNVIDVHVSRLRQKIDKPFDSALIHTVRNAGYMLRAD